MAPDHAKKGGLGVPGLRASAWEKVSFLPADAKHSSAGQTRRRPRVNQKGFGTINLNLRTPLHSLRGPDTMNMSHELLPTPPSLTCSKKVLFALLVSV